ncbi:hypothetical protein B0T19DRAFT_445557 [Cercophora scortea]|uniref:Gfo/Idh/MocA-like oxidoreductase N-terminal domain-containing protein n=1 Tax=Cercophora scortea TaxID=314031 RepID=A0AAE0M5X3_9PEZI|nr:hypothetical protein B0T19DRAFT_445557 [Cercophora scortea]
MVVPIRVAIIGLSANAITDWASRAHLPYFLSPTGKAKFQIIALCNSNVESARRSIKAFGLPSDTRAYGSPEDLAKDPDVQLVVCSTRVDKHYNTTMPSIKAGKDVLVEWPLAEDGTKARELRDEAKKAGGRTIVGLQGWYVPTTLKLKEIIASGRIGKVLSSEVRAARWLNDNSVPDGLKYFAQRAVGGNFVTIGFGHVWDWVQNVLGDVENIESRLQIQRPRLKVLDSYTGRTIETIKSDVPDLISLTGSLPESEHVVKGATFAMRFRRARAFQGEPALVWTIFGERGEIRLTAAVDNMLQVSQLADVTIEIDDHESRRVQRVDFRWEAFKELSYLSRSYGPIYEAYANGDTTGKYGDFDHAVRRHDQLDALFASFDASEAAKVAGPTANGAAERSEKEEL